MAPNFSLSVLGSTTLLADGSPVPLRPKEREVLAAIALRHPGPPPRTRSST
ncbi:MAG: hypothetical protein M5U31_09735 [Acidimicrobiia bacterium]|nr:hypothetical protein [Acidimicrobiia bacterium]